MRTWLGLPDDDPFGVQNLPYGCASGSDGALRTVVRVGAQMLDLTAATRGTQYGPLFAGGTLDALLRAGRPTWAGVRELIQRWLTAAEHRTAIEPLLEPVAAAALHLPFTVADYVDFYASEHHAARVGRLFRPGSDPLPQNWRHLPIGYHGRAGTVVVSGTDIHRPRGQVRDPDGQVRLAPTARLDLEAEVAFVVGTGSPLGASVPVADFAKHVFGVCLLNDWSARDIQSWEYVPLGPFLGKSFATTVSAWVTPLAALAHAWTAPPPRNPAPLAYLDDSATPSGLDLHLQVSLNQTVVSRPPFATLYWTPAQLLAHMTVNGASLRPGDLYASGTVSGPRLAQAGSLLELTNGGARPVLLGDGARRGFLDDGDEVLLTAWAPGGDGHQVALGEVRGRILAANG